VLAVGDELFQRKCLRRLREFREAGGTVIFVSHAMAQVAALCDRCVWLDHGRLLYDGPTEGAVERYLAVVAEREEEEFRRTRPDEWALREAEREAERRAAEEREQEGREESLREASLPWRLPGRSRVLGVTLSGPDGRPRERFTAGESMRVTVPYRFTRALPEPAFCVEIYRASDNLHMFTTSNFDHRHSLRGLPEEGEVSFDVPFLALNEGRYRVRLSLYGDWRPGDWESCLEDVVEDALQFEVSAGPFAHGCTYLPVHWAGAPGTAAAPAASVVAEGGR